MATLGQIIVLQAKNVTSDAIERYRCRLLELPQVFPFDCALCGAEREGKFLDPGIINVKDFVCSDASPPALCVQPALPRCWRRELQLLPGSLVHAPYNHFLGETWPAIVEDCPFGTEDRMLLEKEAYFVTFIFVDANINNYRGAYVEADKLRTFLPNVRPKNTTASYGLAEAVASRAFYIPLADRLKYLSFVAAVEYMRRTEPGLAPETALPRYSSSRSEGGTFPLAPAPSSNHDPNHHSFSGVSVRRGVLAQLMN